MERSSRAGQAGISFFGLIFILAILAAVGLVVARALPTALEYQAIVKNVERSKTGNTPAEIRISFDRGSNVDDITSIQSKDLEITKEGDRYVIRFAYNKEIPMFGPAYLLLKYAYQTK